MTKRVGRGVKKFMDLHLATRKMVRDLLSSIRLKFDNFEYNKHRATGNSVAIANEVFDFIDRNKDGYITLAEFKVTMQNCGMKGTNQDFSNLFGMFDLDFDGKISFDEFHNPGKTADIQALDVL